MVDGGAHERYGLIAISLPSPLTCRVDLYPRRRSTWLTSTRSFCPRSRSAADWRDHSHRRRPQRAFGFRVEPIDTCGDGRLQRGRHTHSGALTHEVIVLPRRAVSGSASHRRGTARSTNPAVWAKSLAHVALTRVMVSVPGRTPGPRSICRRYAMSCCATSRAITARGRTPSSRRDHPLNLGAVAEFRPFEQPGRYAQIAHTNRQWKGRPAQSAHLQ